MHVKKIREITNDNTLHMMKVLKEWQLKSQRATVGELLKWFKQVQVSMKEHYLQLYC